MHKNKILSCIHNYLYYRSHCNSLIHAGINWNESVWKSRPSCCWRDIEHKNHCLPHAWESFSSEICQCSWNTLQVICCFCRSKWSYNKCIYSAFFIATIYAYYLCLSMRQNLMRLISIYGASIPGVKLSVFV